MGNVPWIERMPPVLAIPLGTFLGTSWAAIVLGMDSGWVTLVGGAAIVGGGLALAVGGRVWVPEEKN